jgi:hypothetical protein
MVMPYLNRAVAEAQRLGLGVQVGDRLLADPSGAAAGLFAGLGEVEAAIAEAPGKPRVSLTVIGAQGRVGEHGQEHA